MAIPKISKESVFKALNIIDRDGVPHHNQSMKYNLVTEDGKHYPPKYVVAIAKHIENGTEITTAGFDAGEAVHYLRKLGFTITKQNEQDTPMNKTNPFDWVDFYKEFAQKLLEYKDNRAALIEKVKKIYEITEIKTPTLAKGTDIEDIDPFTVFALFNKGITDENRIKITKAIRKLFNVNAPHPTSFDGIPLVNNQNATYYPILDNPVKQNFDDLWKLFESALDYAQNRSVSNRDRVTEYIGRVIKVKGNAYAKITMGLFWIAPNTYINLDGTNKKYIYKSGELPKEVLSGIPKLRKSSPPSLYFEILERLRRYIDSNANPYKTFPELRRTAYYFDYEIVDPAPDPVDSIQEPRYWLYAPGAGAQHWEQFFNEGTMGLGWDDIGDLTQYHSKKDIQEALKNRYGFENQHNNDALCLWQFSREMKPGDVVFVKKGKFKIIGRGVVKSDYVYKPNAVPNFNFRYVEWTAKGECDYPKGHTPLKTLTDISNYTGLIEELESQIAEWPPIDRKNKNRGRLQPPPSPKYTKEDFLNEVYFDGENYDLLTSLLQRKKNIILQGAPGVGKTFAARRLAYSLMGMKDKSRVMMIQFHQSYSYEDFIMGFRPTERGFELKQGAFYEFCKAAADDNENDYYFIIDEINRGNLSKIFGELFMLIESDKRGIELRLLYENEKFSVPKNVYIIGTMNTADRSLAMLDFALRRRFAFFELKPGFDTDGFKTYQDEVDSDEFNKLIETVKQLNAIIAADDSLGKGFCLGHSFFCNLDEDDPETRLSEIVNFELVPLLEEYWFDEPDKVSQWSEKLRKSIQ